MKRNLLGCLPILTLFIFGLPELNVIGAPQFAGENNNATTGLSYLRARYYDPETGSYLTKDPLGVSGGINNYCYCYGNPVCYVDPDGTRTYLVFFGQEYQGQSPIFLNAANLEVQTLQASHPGDTVFKIYTPMVKPIITALQNNSDIAGIYYFGHGIPGALTLGQEKGDDFNLSTFGGDVKAGANSATGSTPLSALPTQNIAPDAQIFLYSCNATISYVGGSSKNADMSIAEGMADYFGVPVTGAGAGVNYPSGRLPTVSWAALDGVILNSMASVGSTLWGPFTYGEIFGTGGFQTVYPDPLMHALMKPWYELTPTDLNIIGGAGNGLFSGSLYYGLFMTPPVGGVLLDKAATLVGANLSDITGAMYDSVSGQFVFLGTNNPTPVKNINLDYLTTALQAVYGSAVPPFVTLVPSAEITSSATQTETLTVIVYQHYPDQYTTHTVSGTFTSPFLDLYPNPYYGSGNSVIIFPGDWAVASLNYAPIWPGVDSTVDVELRGTDYGQNLNQAVSFCWDARFNCVGTNLVFSQWIADAHHSTPNPSLGITLSYNSNSQFNGQGYDNLTLQNGGFYTGDYIVVTAASAIPTVQQRQFGGRVENTEVGWVMEEADRVMKCLCIGTDNLTGAPYNSSTISVPGYKNLVELYANSNPSGNISTRQWFTPQLMTLAQYINPTNGQATIVFSNATVLCQTENDLTGGTSPPQQQAFCNNMTANYDKFAALQFPCYDPNDPTGSHIIHTNIFGMLKDVMKAVSLARFFRDNHIPVDMWWLNSWQPPIAYAPKSVPTIVNYSANNTYTVSGGVQIQLPNAYIASLTASNVAAVVQASRPAVAGNASGDIQAQVWTNTTSIGTLNAVAANTAAEPQDGNVNLAETDLSFASPGSLSLQFTRFYQSSWLGGDAMGPGWLYTPYVLQFSRPSWYDDYGWMTNNGVRLPVFPGTSDTGLRSDNLRVVNLASGATLDFVSSLVLGYAVSANNQPYITLNGLDKDGVPTFIPGQRRDGSVLIQEAGQREYQLFTPDGLTIVFDSNGKLLYTQDRNGWEQDYTYDVAGHLLRITDDAQQSLFFGYDALTNYLTSVVGPNGEQMNYTYVNGCLATATHVRSGASVNYGYNSNRQLVAKTMFNGLNAIQSQPDLKGRANTNLDVRGNSTVKTFTQGSTGTVRTNEIWDPQITGSQFVHARLQRDRSGRLLASRTVTGAETTFGYNTNSLWPNTLALPIAGRPSITIRRDAYGRPTRVTDPGNTNALDITATYDPNTTLLQQITDQGGGVRQLNYDGNQNLTSVHTTLGAQNVNVNFGYAISGALTSLTNPLGAAVVTIKRDYLDRATNVVDAAGVSLSYQYDSLGRLAQVIDPRLSSPVTYHYDNFDRVTEVDYPVGNIYYGYDLKMGWLTSQTDVLGRTTRYDRDPKTGDILQTVQIVPGGANLTTVMSYDRFGNLASVTPPQSATIAYSYDAGGRQIGSVYSGISSPGTPLALICNWATNGVPTIITNLTFSWSPPVSGAGILGYSYALDQFPANVTNTVGTNAIINSSPLGTHLFQVIAQDTNGNWGPSADFQLVITNVASAAPPAAPPNLVCDHATNAVPTGYAGSFTFSWSVPGSQNGISGYSYALDQAPANQVSTTGTVATFANLSSGTHWFHVQALGANGVWGPTADFVLLLTPPIAMTVPDAPPGLACDHATNGAVTYYTNFVFSWSVPNSQYGVAGYNYALDQTPGNTVLTASTNVAINNVSLGTHLFQVQAQDGNGSWGPAAAFSFLIISPPGTPIVTCNHAANGGNTTYSNLVFSWQPPSTSAGLNGYSYGFDQTPANITNTVGTSVPINNVTLGGHQFEVMAQDTNGVWGPIANFQFTIWKHGTQPPDAPPSLVCNLTSNGVPVQLWQTNAASNVVFTWQAPNSENGLAGYSYSLNGTPTNVVNTTATSVTFATVAVGTYTFQVMAKGNNGVWGPTSSFQLTVQEIGGGGGGESGPLPPWSIILLALGVFTVGAWFSRRQNLSRHPKT
jgi:RHS repeat-associated protein